MRDLDKTVLMASMDTGWGTAHRNVLITGPTGVDKTYLTCAIANQTCRRGQTALYRQGRWTGSKDVGTVRQGGCVVAR